MQMPMFDRKSPTGALPHWTRRGWMLFASALTAIALTPAAFGDDANGGNRGRHWVASWATATAANFVYVAPVPPTFPPGAPTARAPANIQPDLAFPFPGANTVGATNQT